MADKHTILVAEDDAFLRKVYMNKLKREGFEAIAAVDGEEAINRTKEMRPDIVILDMVMPKYNGFEVLERLKKDPNVKDIPVLILSNLGQSSDLQRGLELGAVDYLVKSNLSINEIIAKVRKTIEKRKEDEKEKEEEEAPQQTAPEEEHAHKSNDAYQLFIKPNQADAPRLQADRPELNHYHCSKCGGEIALMLQPMDDNPKRYHAAFICPACRQSHVNPSKHSYS